MDSKLQAMLESDRRDAVLQLATALYPYVVLSGAIRQTAATYEQTAEHAFTLAESFLKVALEREVQTRAKTE